MRTVCILRHATKDNETGQLTEEGKLQVIALNGKIGHFDIVIASDQMRAQETALLLTGVTPEIDRRAGIINTTEAQSKELNRRAFTHKLGFIGALYDTPDLTELVQKQAEQLISLIKDTLKRLPPNGRAMIVSHDITMVPAKKLLLHESLATPLITFAPLSGFCVNEALEVRDHQP